LVLLTPVPGHALFHLAYIDEVTSGVGGDQTAQYVEIRMLTSSQDIVTNTRLTAFSCDGSTSQVLLLVGSNVANSGADVRWIMGTPSFATASGISPDFT